MANVYNSNRYIDNMRRLREIDKERENLDREEENIKQLQIELEEDGIDAAYIRKCDEKGLV